MHKTWHNKSLSYQGPAKESIKCLQILTFLKSLQVLLSMEKLVSSPLCSHPISQKK